MASNQGQTIPKPIRASLISMLREFTRCSNLYLPLFHERFVPTVDLSGCLPEICEAFRNAHADQFSDGWEEWDGPISPNSLERFHGCEDGLCEFRQLGDSIQLIIREIDQSRPNSGYLGWLDLLYEMAHGYPTPLLRCSVDRWNERLIEDSSGDELDSIGNRGGVPFPLFPLHFVLANSLFTSSVSAIELILDDDKALLVGEWTVRMRQALRRADELAKSQKRQRKPDDVKEAVDNLRSAGKDKAEPEATPKKTRSVRFDGIDYEDSQTDDLPKYLTQFVKWLRQNPTASAFLIDIGEEK